MGRYCSECYCLHLSPVSIATDTGMRLPTSNFQVLPFPPPFAFGPMPACACLCAHAQRPGVRPLSLWSYCCFQMLHHSMSMFSILLFSSFYQTTTTNQSIIHQLTNSIPRAKFCLWQYFNGTADCESYAFFNGISITYALDKLDVIR